MSFNCRHFILWPLRQIAAILILYHNLRLLHSIFLNIAATFLRLFYLLAYRAGLDGLGVMLLIVNVTRFHLELIRRSFGVSGGTIFVVGGMPFWSFLIFRAAVHVIIKIINQLIQFRH